MQIKLKRSSNVALNDQLYEALRGAIVSGELRAGQPLPSSRKLASDVDVARATVLECFKRLIDEGYIETIAASRTIVSLKLPSESRAVSFVVPQLSAFGTTMLSRDFSEIRHDERDLGFLPGRPSFDETMLEDWSRTVARTFRTMQPGLLDFAPDRAGSYSLRNAISQTVAARGINCKPEQVIVVLGFQQAMDLILRIHLDRGDLVAIEDPSFPEVRPTLDAHGLQAVGLQLDGDGIVTAKLAEMRARLVIATPSHQYPTGGVMTLDRRLELVHWAAVNGAIVVEDDYDSEFRYEGKPTPSLMALDRHGCVIYVHTFTKALYASIGIGYLVVPAQLAEVYANTRRLQADPVPMHLQEALATFITEGNLAKHERRLRKIYAERRTALLSALRTKFRGRATISGENAGLHLLVRFHTSLTTEQIKTRAARRGVGLVSTDDCYLSQPVQREFAMGYGNLTVEQIQEGVERLARVMPN